MASAPLHRSSSTLLNRSPRSLLDDLGGARHLILFAVARPHLKPVFTSSKRMDALPGSTLRTLGTNACILRRSGCPALASSGIWRRRNACAVRDLSGTQNCGGKLWSVSPVFGSHLFRQRRLHQLLENRSTIRQSRRSCASTVSADIIVNVPVSVEESTVMDGNLEALVEQLEKDGPLAVNLAVEDLEEAEGATTIELSVLLCSDPYIQQLNKEWRSKDSVTDVLSFPQPARVTPIWLLGDIVISVDTAARQAKDRGHTVLDEIRILLVHGLLHVLGYDHELEPEAAQEMQNEEERILRHLGWKGDGLISSALQSSSKEELVHQSLDSTHEDDGAVKTAARRRPPPFKLLLCDMDGTLLNSQSKVTKRTADAVRAAIAAGVQVVVATGKARPAAIAALELVGLAYDGGAISLTSPGVFLQGLLVYGREGFVVHSKRLASDICSEAFTFSLEHGTPLVGFAGDQCVTLRGHPNIDLLHSVYYEPKAQVMPSVDQIVENVPIQKLVFCDTEEGVSSFLRPYWFSATTGRATVVQAVPHMLEILPAGTSKGGGVQYLLEHMGIPREEVMAIGDGENDKEMIQLAGLGVAMANGAPPTLAVADVQVGSNDEDGVAEAIERFILG